MLRVFVWLLMFLVVFLSGMLFGINREDAQFNIPDGFEMIPSEKTEVGTKTASIEEEIIIVEQEVDVEAPVHLTQKTASLLEAGVKGFYEVIVEILYQISTLFFKKAV